MEAIRLQGMLLKPEPCFRYRYSNYFRGIMKKVFNQQVVCAASSSYHRFVDFALNQSTSHTQLIPSPPQERVSGIQAINEKAQLDFLSFEAPKIRLLRSMYINGGDSLQVLDLAIFPKLEYDLPIFCANFFSNPAITIVVLDLNPLHNVITDKHYKDKYYRDLMPLGAKYAELLPWGGKLTSESLRFFSPIVIWTRFPPTQEKNDVLFQAFQDYFKAWMDLMDEAVEESDAARILLNMEAQHKYLTWRTEKDPGHQMLKNLVGETGAQDVLKSFLFSGVDELGSKTFLDYFPEYKLEDGTVNGKRSVMGKSFETRPWDSRGEFIAD